MNEPTIRAKFRVSTVDQHRLDDGEVVAETVDFTAVGPRDGYPGNSGDDENNTYAKWTPIVRSKMGSYFRRVGLHPIARYFLSPCTQ